MASGVRKLSGLQKEVLSLYRTIFVKLSRRIGKCQRELRSSH